MSIKWHLFVMGFALSMLATPSIAQPIDFARDIRPILDQHCAKCHNDRRSEAGLSLESYAAALTGGESGKPVLGGTLETNEFLRRIKHNDLDLRMPLDGPPLTQGEIAQLERWVQEGTPWPTEVQDQQEGLLKKANGFIAVWVTPYLPYWIALIILIVIIERLKVVQSKREKREEKSDGWLAACLKRINLPVYLVAALCMVLGVLIDRMIWLNDELDHANAQRLAMDYTPTFESVFGDPPTPIRPTHPSRLGGTYYRGNSERNPALYNNGYYLTATLELSLVDSKGRRLQYGSAVEPDEKLQIRLQIKAAPNATPVLFSEKIMSSLILATGYSREGLVVSPERSAAFTATDQADTWEVYYPLSETGDNTKGLIYLYRGEVIDSGSIQTDGEPHVGIVYDLKLEDGQIQAGSDLWLGAIYYPEIAVALPTPNMIPWHQWYDYRPMPIIEGQNTSDPELLGITEYEETGQIKASD